ncbi:SGNH/GDSL hydrolase family protein [Paenibacillus elgii]|uniref:SGNH/GDSL hydrolase family protein n=1 Tax=Paenibacillus elgii TaxID=189691 RepID=A0A2T6G7V3_9BACL|nr:GDSL-type esterase/lipase family protein [Paenibacillus elgii]PUA40235.1 SGNH/GDSL hydrolase family protein [Paenibacillus elgii]
MNLLDFIKGIIIVWLAGISPLDTNNFSGCTNPDYFLAHRTACRQISPVVKTLEYEAAQNKALSIATMGSSVTGGMGASQKEKNWVSQLAQALKKQPGLSDLQVSNGGINGFSTQNMIDRQIPDRIIRQKPAVVLFETCLLNDYLQNIPIETTNKNIATIMNQLTQGLPGSRIVLLSPNPRRHGEVKNKAGHTYEDYILGTKAFIEQNGWEYIDIYKEMNETLAKKNMNLDQVLSDATHPNDEGYDLWANIVIEYFLKGPKRGNE